MLKMLIPVDGSKNSTRAVKKLVETLAWYKSRPQIDLLAVHLPVRRFPNMSLVVSNEMIERYYADEWKVMLAPSRRVLDAARVSYTVHTVVGSIAESIVEHAKQSGSDMIYMGTRGKTAFSGMVLGSVTAMVLHLAHVPVMLFR